MLLFLVYLSFIQHLRWCVFVLRRNILLLMLIRGRGPTRGRRRAVVHRRSARTAASVVVVDELLFDRHGPFTGDGFRASPRRRVHLPRRKTRVQLDRHEVDDFQKPRESADEFAR